MTAGLFVAVSPRGVYRSIISLPPDLYVRLAYVFTEVNNFCVYVRAEVCVETCVEAVVEAAAVFAVTGTGVDAVTGSDAPFFSCIYLLQLFRQLLFCASDTPFSAHI
jgi:hypothetical protein